MTLKRWPTLSKGKLRNKIPQLRRALEGQVTAHHRALITGHWNRMEFLERQIADLETQIAERMKPTPAEMALTMQNASQDAPAPLSPRLCASCHSAACLAAADGSTLQ